MTTSGDPFAAVQIGATTTVAKTVSETDVYLFAGITGDFSPNHVDEAYMAGSRYGRRIAHGALLVGFMSAATAKMQIGRTASVGYDRVRFVGPVFFGDTITTEYRISAVDEGKRRVFADLTCRNQRDEVVAAATHIRAFVD